MKCNMNVQWGVFSPFIFMHSPYMDYFQRNATAMDVVRADFDENKDEVLKTPNFSLMERFLINGW